MSKLDKIPFKFEVDDAVKFKPNRKQDIVVAGHIAGRIKAGPQPVYYVEDEDGNVYKRIEGEIREGFASELTVELHTRANGPQQEISVPTVEGKSFDLVVSIPGASVRIEVTDGELVVVPEQGTTDAVPGEDGKTFLSVLAREEV